MRHEHRAATERGAHARLCQTNPIRVLPGENSTRGQGAGSRRDGVNRAKQTQLEQEPFGVQVLFRQGVATNCTREEPRQNKANPRPDRVGWGQGSCTNKPNASPAGWDMGARARAAGDGPVVDTANVPNEPNSDGPGTEREVSVNKRSQFDGLGHGQDAHATGDDPVADAANVPNEPNLDGPGPEREGLVNKQSQSADGRKSGPLQLRFRSQCL